MPNPNKTLIVVVLDRSGSMESVRESTISGLNTFLNSQRAIPGETNLHFIQFDDHYEIRVDNRPLSEVREITDYHPRGGTALLDAIGRTIDEVGAQLGAMSEADRPGKVVFVVQTDGYENASVKFTIAQIHQKISHQRTKYSWEFVFLGADQDAIASGGTMGFARNSSLSYSKSAVGTMSAFNSLGQKVGSYRTGLTRSTAFDATDRAKALQTEEDKTALATSPTPLPAGVDPTKVS